MRMKRAGGQSTCRLLSMCTLTILWAGIKECSWALARSFSLDWANMPYESHQIDEETLYLCSVLEYERLCLRRPITCDCEGNLFAVIACDESADWDIALDWLSWGQTKPLFSSQMIVVISCNKYFVSGGERVKNTPRAGSQGSSDLCFVERNQICFWTFSLFRRLIILKKHTQTYYFPYIHIYMS